MGWFWIPIRDGKTLRNDLPDRFLPLWRHYSWLRRKTRRPLMWRLKRRHSPMMKKRGGGGSLKYMMIHRESSRLTVERTRTPEGADEGPSPCSPLVLSVTAQSGFLQMSLIRFHEYPSTIHLVSIHSGKWSTLQMYGYLRWQWWYGNDRCSASRWYLERPQVRSSPTRPQLISCFSRMKVSQIRMFLMIRTETERDAHLAVTNSIENVRQNLDETWKEHRRGCGTRWL